MVPHLHYSFGTGDENDGESTSSATSQHPHVVSRLFDAMDKVVVTGPTDTPPTLGEWLVEDPSYRQKRLCAKSIVDLSISLDDTYTFSCYSENIDLSNWSIVNIPLFSTVSMRSIFEDESIEFVIYEHHEEESRPSTMATSSNGIFSSSFSFKNNETVESEGVHCTKDLEYILLVEVSICTCYLLFVFI